MSDRHYAYTVVLKADIRDDDSEHIIRAIQMIKGVESVSPIVADPQLFVAEERARNALRKALFELLTDA